MTDMADDGQSEYHYYLVESYMVARTGPRTTERLTRGGTWVPYNDRWRVLTEGYRLESEAEALETAKELFDQEDERAARSKGDTSGP